MKTLRVDGVSPLIQVQSGSTGTKQGPTQTSSLYLSVKITVP